MFGLDDRIAALGGHGIVLALVVAALLGLRHATDPDHLTAVSTLMLSGRRHGAPHAARLGFAWGLGHATTLLIFGLPVVLFRRLLPEPVQRAAEVVIGVLIALLAMRLLLRWRRGYFHAHIHAHDGVPHAHPHAHEGRHTPVAHAHAHEMGRTPLAAYGIGLLHGAGGSAGVGILLVGAMPGTTQAVASLVVFALMTAVSMALASTVFGYALARGPVARRVSALIPYLGTASLAFGIWYAATAM